MVALQRYIECEAETLLILENTGNESACNSHRRYEGILKTDLWRKEVGGNMAGVLAAGDA